MRNLWNVIVCEGHRKELIHPLTRINDCCHYIFAQRWTLVDDLGQAPLLGQASVQKFSDIILGSPYIDPLNSNEVGVGDTVANMITGGNEDVRSRCLKISHYFEEIISVVFGTFIQCINDDEDFGELSRQDTHVGDQSPRRWATLGVLLVR